MSSSKGKPAEAPLHGIRVVEVANYMAGPFCATQLADLGADVVKVESTRGGDFVRQSGPLVEGESSGFMRLNRNKRSLALDLKDPRGKELFLSLAGKADVLVQNMRPGAMERLGIGYDVLREVNDRLVYVSISGWGDGGPYAGKAGLDIMAQAMSGLMSITGEPGRPPVKVGVPVCDLTCGLYGALATLAALRARERDGLGQLVEVNLFEAGVSLTVWEAARYFATGEVPRPLGSAHQNSAPYQAVRASDGYFTIGATTPRNWREFCSCLGLEELEADPRFAGNVERHENREELVKLIEAVTVTDTADHWVARLEGVGVPCAAIQSYDQVAHDPHLGARGFFGVAPHSRVGETRLIGSPMRLSRTATRLDRAGPLLGEHSRELLAELGVRDADVAELLAANVVGEPDG